MSSLTELLDVVEHLVNTHTHWNLNLSKDEALAKIAAARLGDVTTLVKDAETVVEDTTGLIKAAEGQTNA